MIAKEYQEIMDELDAMIAELEAMTGNGDLVKGENIAMVPS